MESTLARGDPHPTVSALSDSSRSPDTKTDIAIEKLMQTPSRLRLLKLCQPLEPRKEVEHFLAPAHHRRAAITRSRVSVA